MSQNLRNTVLKAFKTLHKTRKEVFNGDKIALEKARIQINEEYRKNKGVTNLQAIEELVKLSKSVENELKSNVIQAEEVKPGHYQMRLRDDIVRLDNVPFNDCASKQ